MPACGGAVDIVAPVGNQPTSRERLSPESVSGGIAAKRPPEPAVALLNKAVDIPEIAQRDDQPHACIGFMGAAPLERQPQVADIVRKPLVPNLLVTAPELWRRLLSD